MKKNLNINYEKIKDEILLYNYINDLFNKENFCTPKFKRDFNTLYTVRSKSKEWYSIFYNLFARCKRNKLSFRDTLTELYNETGEIHPSYCSKIIYYVFEDKPNWDQYVFNWLGFIIKQPKKPTDRIEYCSRIYDEIDKEYKKHLNDENVKTAIKKFDDLFPEGKDIPQIKKLDFILKSIESEKTISIFDYLDLSDSLK